MTNKLPIVGRLYSNEYGRPFYRVREIKDGLVYISDEGISCNLENFFEYYKELPEDILEKIKEVKRLRTELIKDYNSQQTEQVKENDKANSVEEALRMVKLNLLDYDLNYLKEIDAKLRKVPHFQLIKRVEDLVNALDLI
jgi:hypothetical protein